MHQSYVFGKWKCANPRDLRHWTWGGCLGWEDPGAAVRVGSRWASPLPAPRSRRKCDNALFLQLGCCCCCCCCCCCGCACRYWGSGWALSHIAVDGISWFTCTISVIGPGYHPFISASSLGWLVRASFLLLSLFVPVLPFAFLVFVSFWFVLFPLCCFCFPFFFSPSGWVVFVVPCAWYFGFSAALPCVGASARPVCFAWFCCVISLSWGFGSPQCVLSCSVAWFLCVGASARFVRLRLAASTWCWASARPCHASFCLLALQGGCFAWGCSRSWISCRQRGWVGLWVVGGRGRWGCSFWSPLSCSGATSLDPFFFLVGVWHRSELERISGCSDCSCSVGWRGSGSIPMGSVTWIRGDDNHVQAIRGLWDSGFFLSCLAWSS